MDVDLLRPGNVPISPNTVLWFEFLLNPYLLEEHLKKPNPDPIPSDLLIKFLTLSVEPSNEDILEKIKNFKCSKRHLSMKILSLKIVAYWKWNLEMIELKLPLQLQYVLLRDLLCLTSNDQDQNLVLPAMHHNLNFEQLTDEQIFSISLYHRWTLHVIVNSPMVSKNILCSTTSNVESADEIMSKIMDDEGKSEIILQKIIDLQKDFIICPIFHNFFPPTEECDLKQDWQKGLKVSNNKFYSQIYYDLGTYKLYRELNNEAADYFTMCKKLIDELKNGKNDPMTDGYFEVKKENLEGFCYACGVMIDKNRNLILQFYSAIRDNYTNILNILQEDNTKREIPLSYRDSLELDLASTLASGKFTARRDMLFQIQTLNVIRRVLESSSYPSIIEYATKLNATRKGTVILTKALKPLISRVNNEEKQKIRLFLLTLFDKCDSSLVRNIIADQELSSLFSEIELREARTRFDNELVNITALNEVEENQEKKIKLFGNAQLELCLLERQIIKTYDPLKLKELIIKFLSLSGGRPITNIYNKWEVHHSICKAISSLPNQFLQQYCYTALAKVKELLSIQNYSSALEFITAASEEVKKPKFSVLFSWEALYVNMIELQILWPANRINRSNLLGSCKTCLVSMQQGGDPNFLPRLQIAEQCVITLLNVEREYLTNCNLQKRFRYLELSTVLSLACTDVAKFKGNKKFSKEAWDLIVPAFLTSNLQRRQVGQFSDREGNVNGILSKVAMTQYFVKLRDTSVINVVMSLLSRLHNILRDEPNLELHFLYIPLWPLNVPNSSAYNPDAVIEVIAETLDEALKYQSTNVHWLKLSGDVNFVKEHYSTALKRYFEALAAASDYFIRPVPKSMVEDLIYKRMIKCCSMLQCFTEAAVLCQFLDEIDYTTAFKCLSETISSDATDCYYECIWDINILEFLIALHTKRNEHCKKQKVIDAVGLLELNSNNNEEIKREACNVRKQKFLRAMAKQYIIC